MLQAADWLRRLATGGCEHAPAALSLVLLEHGICFERRRGTSRAAVSLRRRTTVSTTQVSDRFTALPDEQALAATVVALEEHGFSAGVAGNLDAARGGAGPHPPGVLGDDQHLGNPGRHRHRRCGQRRRAV